MGQITPHLVERAWRQPKGWALQLLIDGLEVALALSLASAPGVSTASGEQSAWARTKWEHGHAS